MKKRRTMNSISSVFAGKISRLVWILLFGFLRITPFFGQTISIIDYDEPDTVTYTVPSGITELVVECWGAGGGGSGAIGIQQGANSAPGAGGGGGAYSRSVISVTPGQVFTLFIGAGGAGGTNPWSNDEGEGRPGGNTLFRNANGVNLVVAEGGRGASFVRLSQGGGQGGRGGNFSSSKGDVVYTGGRGADAGSDYSGGGGGAGGSSHDGYNALGMAAGEAGASNSGISGAGGAGRNTRGAGYAGVNTATEDNSTIYAGGGGGFDPDWQVAYGGKGADGHIRIKQQQTLGKITGTSYTEVGKTTRLIPPVSGGVWASSLEEVAIVDSTGLVTGLSPGETVITYTIGNTLSSQSAELHVLVYPVGESIAITGSRSYCTNGTKSINLQASSDMTGDVYWHWSGPNDFVAGTAGFTRPAIEANAGTYTVTASKFTEGAMGNNVIVNGDFESGDTGFTSDYTMLEHSLNGNYYVGTVPHIWGFNGCEDHTSGSGYYISLRGTSSTGNTLWRQTVSSVEPNTNYQFSFWLQAIQYAGADSSMNIKVQPKIAGSDIGTVYEKETSKTCNGWVEFVYNWNSGTNTSAVIELNLDTLMSDNYMVALDDISFREISEGSYSIVTESVDIQVGTLLTPIIDVISIPKIPLVGRTNTFVASAQHTGVSPTYEWYVNDSLATSGDEVIFVRDDLQAGDEVKCVLIPDNIGCDLAGAYPSTTFVVQESDKNYWLGFISGQWSVAGNWTKSRIPVEGEDLEFATPENNGQEVVRDLETTESNVSVKDYINDTYKKLIVTPGTSLTITGQINTFGFDRILIQASETQPNGSLIFPDATAPLATVEFWSKARILSGEATNNQMKWQYFGIPIQTGLPASPTFTGAYVRKYKETLTTAQSGSQWVQLTGDSILVPFEGYEIAQDNPKKYTFSGTLVKDSLVRTLSYTASSYYAGQHILSNPYTAAIDITKMHFGGGLDSTVYLFNTGTYVQWTGGVLNSGQEGSYIAIPKMQATAMGFNIPSMQGFLIRVLDDTQDRTLRFDYSSVIKNTMQLKSAASKTFLTATLESEHYQDKVWLFWEDHCTSGFDNGWDGCKIASSGNAAQLYITGQSENYQVSSTNDFDSVYIAFQPGKEDTEYRLSLAMENLSALYDTLALLDLETGESVDLLARDSLVFHFTSDPEAKAVKRFLITSDPAKINEKIWDNGLVKVYSYPGRICIDNGSNDSGVLMVYDLMGQNLLQKSFEANNRVRISTSFIPGIYIAKVLCGDRIITQKIRL